MIIKIQTTEGFHTKIVNCDNIEMLGKVSETFVMSMPEATGKTKFINTAKETAAEIVLPFLDTQWAKVENLPEFTRDYFNEFDI